MPNKNPPLAERLLQQEGPTSARRDGKFYGLLSLVAILSLALVLHWVPHSERRQRLAYHEPFLNLVWLSPQSARTSSFMRPTLVSQSTQVASGLAVQKIPSTFGQYQTFAEPTGKYQSDVDAIGRRNMIAGLSAASIVNVGILGGRAVAVEDVPKTGASSGRELTVLIEKLEAVIDSAAETAATAKMQTEAAEAKFLSVKSTTESVADLITGEKKGGEIEAACVQAVQDAQLAKADALAVIPELKKVEKAAAAIEKQAALVVAKAKTSAAEFDSIDFGGPIAKGIRKDQAEAEALIKEMVEVRTKGLPSAESYAMAAAKAAEKIEAEFKKKAKDKKLSPNNAAVSVAVVAAGKAFAAIDDIESKVDVDLKSASRRDQQDLSNLSPLFTPTLSLSELKDAVG